MDDPLRAFMSPWARYLQKENRLARTEDFFSSKLEGAPIISVKSAYQQGRGSQNNDKWERCTGLH